jgi:hypothetical protein
MTDGRLLNAFNQRSVIQNGRHPCTPHYFCIPQSEFGTDSELRMPHSDAISRLITEFAGEICPFSLRFEILVRAPVQARFG